MEFRLLLAYALIALMAAAIGSALVHNSRKRAARKRMWQGRSRHRTDP